MEEEGWEKIEGRMSRKFRGNCTPTIRKFKKESTKGGIIIAINKSLKETRCWRYYGDNNGNDTGG